MRNADKMEKLDFPNRITVELTNFCNVSCIFCPRQEVRMEMGYMSDELYYKIIDEASLHLPVKLVIFFRGESLLHSKFMEFVRYAKGKGVGPVQFATNGLALDPEISDEIVKAGVDFVSCSLDTVDPEVYRRSRLTGDLSKSMQNFLYLSTLCRQCLREGRNAPILQVSTIETNDYIMGQERFVDYWKEYVDDVRVYYEHDDNGGFRNDKVQRFVEEKVSERRPCRKVFTDFLIYWNGDLALCNYDWRGGIRDVNVRDMSIQQAWDSEEYDSIRKMHLSNTIDENIMCKSCQHWRIDYMDKGFLGKVYRGKLSKLRE